MRAHGVGGKENMGQEKPVVMSRACAHWPAVKTWRDLDYLRQQAGNRLVPVELGETYHTTGVTLHPYAGLLPMT